jgi:GntR family transcriptional regulator
METDKVSRSGGEHREDEPGSPIAFYLDPASGAPVYRQLVQQVERALLLGYLREGDRLPRIREVTATLAVNPDTVQKAYRELETRGIAEGRRGRGTFVVGAPDLPNIKDIERLRRRLLGWLADADATGLTEDMTAAMFSAASRDHDWTGRSKATVPGASDRAPTGPAGKAVVA